MNEKPNNVIPIEKGKEIQINTIKTQIEKIITGLKLLLTDIDEKYDDAQEYGDDERIKGLLDIIFRIEQQIRDAELLFKEADEELHKFAEQSLEKKRTIENMR